MCCVPYGAQIIEAPTEVLQAAADNIAIGKHFGSAVYGFCGREGVVCVGLASHLYPQSPPVPLLFLWSRPVGSMGVDSATGLVHCVLHVGAPAWA